MRRMDGDGWVDKPVLFNVTDVLLQLRRGVVHVTQLDEDGGGAGGRRAAIVDGVDGEIISVGSGFPVQHPGYDDHPGAGVNLEFVRNPGKRVAKVAVPRPHVLVHRRDSCNLGTGLGILKACSVSSSYNEFKFSRPSADSRYRPKAH